MRVLQRQSRRRELMDISAAASEEAVHEVPSSPGHAHSRCVHLGSSEDDGYKTNNIREALIFSLVLSLTRFVDGIIVIWDLQYTLLFSLSSASLVYERGRWYNVFSSQKNMDGVDMDCYLYT
ncbi:hypothetical protein CEXT_46731 [Caerostris extrusa]|uniref:Uncharacterized protein n=1 Tax=Caerostris extrusa TaxID=172846 RepID=A0AAV4MUS2_CAEEX|nr:hypothetical protein CEXT_46731 [Caerostris extrusa]